MRERERKRRVTFVELLPERIPYLCFDLEPLARVGIAVLFSAFRLFGIQFWLSLVSCDRDYLNILFVRDFGLYAWSALPFAAASRHGLNAGQGIM
jgi:hypothetical protein